MHVVPCCTPDPNTYDCSGSIPDDRLEPLIRVTCERDMLAEAIANAAIKAGIYNGEVPLTGPHMLMLCDDLAEVIKSLEDNIGVKANFIEATIDNSINDYWKIALMENALRAIIDRSNNGELGSSKVIDMRKIAEKALKELE